MTGHYYIENGGALKKSRARKILRLVKRGEDVPFEERICMPDDLINHNIPVMYK
jgi:hypothetical protein